MEFVPNMVWRSLAFYNFGPIYLFILPVACIEIKQLLTKVSVIRDFLKYHKSWNIWLFLTKVNNVLIPQFGV